MSPIINRLINIYITVADFQIEPAIRISANPGLILNSGSLTTEIGKGNQITRLTFLAFGEIVVKFQEIHLHVQLINEVYTKPILLARGIELN